MVVIFVIVTLLVSEDIFLKINDIKEPRSKNFPLKYSDEKFPLKRFITCGRCGTTWVGYEIKQKSATYYKCNQRGCRCNRNADQMHDGFREYLSSFTIPEKFVEPLKMQLSLTFKTFNAEKENSKISLRKRLGEVEAQLFVVEERYALGKVGEEVYEKIRLNYVGEISNIENELKKVEHQLSNHDNFVNYSVKLSGKLNVLWGSGDFGLKQNLQRLVFPAGVIYNFDNSTYRTTKMNTIFSYNAGVVRLFEKENSGITLLYKDHSALVARTGIEPVFPP